MIETVVSIALPVGERLTIEKNRLLPQGADSETDRDKNRKRLAIVTGIHGDELEGQSVCYELNRRLAAHPEHLKGIVDIYPAVNPLGIDSVTRSIPMFDLDMNRIFPGSRHGSMAEQIAAGVIEDLSGADLCIDIHASDIYLREVAQVRISEDTAQQLLPWARLLNADFVWIHASATVLEATLAHSLNMIGTPTLAVEMGVGMRITRQYTEQLVTGIFRVMQEMGIWDGPTEPVRTPVISTDGEVELVNASCSGIFMPCAAFGTQVKKSTLLGEIVRPLTGQVLERVLSPIDGLLFTRREYPVVYEGALLARVLGGEKK